MAYDTELDVTIEESSIVIDKNEKVVIGVYSYNDGEPKYGEKRLYQNRDGSWRIGRIGRKSVSEITKILPVMKEMLGTLKTAQQKYLNLEAQKTQAKADDTLKFTI